MIDRRTLGRRAFGRHALASTLLVGLPPLAKALAEAIPPDGRIPFSVFRNRGDRIGHHRLSFFQEDGALVMEKEVVLTVKVAFIVAYRYRHKSRETWRNGRLVGLDTETNDDGKAFRVRGRAGARGFEVEGASGAFTAPADVRPTSYWDKGALAASRLLDTQRGVMMDVQVEDIGQEKIAAAGRTIPARHYRVTFVSNRPEATDRVELWYDDSGAWVKMAFRAKGQDIDYVLDPPTGPAQAATLPPRG